MKEITRTVDNPGFGPLDLNREKFVKRWTDWSKDFGKLCDHDWDENLKFQARVKELAEKQFDRD
jgi:hypothetical protein